MPAAVRPDAVSVNGRRYAWPARPTVVVCLDGSEPAYTEAAIAAGLMRNLARIIAKGTSLLAEAVIPSFTNPNNLSIACGAPPAVHGISGNFFIDPESGKAVMMNDPSFLRAPTIFAAFSQAGARVAVVTAKDKLRLLLGHGMAGGVCLSAERADKAAAATHGLDDALGFVGLPLPDVYSAALSEFVLAAGVRLLERMRPDLMYLSTTDYIQHKHAPGSAEANAFYAMVDRHLGALDALGATLAVTADHGMNDKHDATGRPNVLYLQDMLDGWLGAGASTVILPITDPYVVHHGALGSFATVHLHGAAAGQGAALLPRIAALAGIDLVLPRDAACARFGLPPDRMGDLVVISARHMTVGTSAAAHDLSGLDAPLRSHGGLTEQIVPMIFNRPLAVPLAAPPATGAPRPRNYDVFALALNGLAPN
ncbi:MAG: phosphonoacetate hydrolase [Alphaproteobacteria bacterium]|nr:phosphonoacetate hydrolase [Alphaproteobacteria bacterium]